MKAKTILLLSAGVEASAVHILKGLKQINADNERLVVLTVEDESVCLDRIKEAIQKIHDNFDSSLLKEMIEISDFKTTPNTLSFSFLSEELPPLTEALPKIISEAAIQSVEMLEFTKEGERKLNTPWYDQHTLNKSKKCKNGNFRQPKFSPKKTYRGR